MIRRLALGLVAVVAALPLAAGAGPDATVGRFDPALLAGEIPQPMLGAYLDAAGVWEVDWALLAAIGKLECDHGRLRAPGCWPPGTTNAAGARGPMQFVGSTWRATADHHDLDVAGPPVDDGHGYATDGDHDGVADPWSVYDAVHAAARYLADHHGSTDPHAAARAYNAGPANPDRDAGVGYADRALELMSHYHRLAGTAGPGSPASVVAAPAGAAGGGCTLADPTGTGGCVTPRTAHLVAQIRVAYPAAPLACWGRRPANPSSDHPHGRACDITIGAIGRFPIPAERTYGWAIAGWLTANASPLAIDYLVWDGQIWHPGTGWRRYTGGGAYNPTSPTGGHFDHIHISVH